MRRTQGFTEIFHFSRSIRSNTIYGMTDVPYFYTYIYIHTYIYIYIHINRQWTRFTH